jgi:hypothetical protein
MNLTIDLVVLLGLTEHESGGQSNSAAGWVTHEKPHELLPRPLWWCFPD